jgi:hypothetical protein
MRKQQSEETTDRIESIYHLLIRQIISRIYKELKKPNVKPNNTNKNEQMV